MILCDKLSYTYKTGKRALTDVNAAIRPGIHLLMGENGAGKTTLLHLLAGLLFPTQGSCRLDDVEMRLRRPGTMRRVFFLADDMSWPAPTINEMVKTHAVFFPAFDEVLLRTNLLAMGQTGSESLAAMSLGNRKKAAVAYALSLRPDVLLLDEPANGLDISAKKALQKMLLQSTSDEQTVIISTHTVWDLQNLFESVMMVRGGYLLLNMAVYDILERVAFVNLPEPDPDAIYAEEEVGGYNSIIPNDGTIDTNINFTLLYSAFTDSAAMPKLVNLLNSKHGNNSATE